MIRCASAKSAGVFMFQKSRPPVSNRFHADSSSTSLRILFIPSVTLRTPPSNALSSSGSAEVLQQAHNGSHPNCDSGNTTSASLAAARSHKYSSHLRVRKGISQPTIKFHTGRFELVDVSANAVKIPPNGPCPGQRSATIFAGASEYFPSAATIRTFPHTTKTNSAVRDNIV